MPMVEGIGCGVAIVIWNEDYHVLMGKRKGSHAAGTWCFPGGWKEKRESFEQTAIREALEETGLVLEMAELIPGAVTCEYHSDKDIESVTIYLRTPYDQWHGTPVVKEPEKLEGEWTWVDPEALPQPLFPGIPSIQHLLTMHGDPIRNRLQDLLIMIDEGTAECPYCLGEVDDLDDLSEGDVATCLECGKESILWGIRRAVSLREI